MYIKLDEYDTDMIKRYLEKFDERADYIMIDKNMLITPDDLLDIFYTLDYYCTDLEEEYEEYKQNVQDNYKQINVADQYEVSDHDFI